MPVIRIKGFTDYRRVYLQTFIVCYKLARKLQDFLMSGILKMDPIMMVRTVLKSEATVFKSSTPSMR